MFVGNKWIDKVMNFFIQLNSLFIGGVEQKIYVGSNGGAWWKIYGYPRGGRGTQKITQDRLRSLWTILKDRLIDQVYC